MINLSPNVSKFKSLVGEYIFTEPLKYFFLEQKVNAFIFLNLKAVKAETEEDAKKLVEHLRKNNLGRASFLPMEPPNRSLSASKTLPKYWLPRLLERYLRRL